MEVDVSSRSGFAPLRVLEALATPHGIDRYLELVHPMWTVREPRAEVTDVRRTESGSTTVTLRPNRHWRGYTAGQFVQVSVEVDGVRRTRCFSPAGSQHRADGLLEFTVKAHPDGFVSRFLHDHAAPGMVVGLSQADGTFTLPQPRPDRLVLISGGSGVTPVLSMLRTLCDEQYTGEVVFLHYTRTAADLPYLAELRTLADHHDNVRVVLAHTADQGGDLRGHFEETHLADIAPWYADASAYLCGPASLMAAVREHYAAKGIEDQLHSEEFVLASVAMPDGDVDGAVSGAVSFGDTVVDNSGATLLEQAEAAGLSPEYGCRMGICFSCTKVKTSGCTRNVRTGDLHTEPDSEIQLCISVPVGDVEIDI